MKSKKGAVKKSAKKGRAQGLEQEIQEIEQWVIERKKFFIKLAWIVGLVTVLIIVSHWYLRVKGIGL